MRYTGRGFVVCLLLLALLASLNACSLLGGRTQMLTRRKFVIQAGDLNLSLPDSERPYPFSVQLKKFEVLGFYDRNQIVFRLSEAEVKEDRWHIWAVRPSDMITGAVEQYFKDARLFSHVSQEFLDLRPDFIFTGTIEAIERFDSGDLWFAHMAISMQMMDQGNQTVWTRKFEVKQQVYNQDMVYTVETLSEILRHQMQLAILDLDFKFLNIQHQREGRPLAGEKPLAEPAAMDTAATAAPPAGTADYEIIPGKLAPAQP